MRVCVVLLFLVTFSGCAALSHGGSDVCAVAEAVFCPLKESDNG